MRDARQQELQGSWSAEAHRLLPTGREGSRSGEMEIPLPTTTVHVSFMHSISISVLARP